MPSSPYGADRVIGQWADRRGRPDDLVSHAQPGPARRAWPIPPWATTRSTTSAWRWISSERTPCRENRRGLRDLQPPAAVGPDDPLLRAAGLRRAGTGDPRRRRPVPAGRGPPLAAGVGGGAVPHPGRETQRRRPARFARRGSPGRLGRRRSVHALGVAGVRGRAAAGRLVAAQPRAASPAATARSASTGPAGCSIPAGPIAARRSTGPAAIRTSTTARTRRWPGGSAGSAPPSPIRIVARLPAVSRLPVAAAASTSPRPDRADMRTGGGW